MRESILWSKRMLGVTRGRVGRHQSAAEDLRSVHLLHLHPAVLEPDLDLAFGQVQHAGYVNSPVSRQVHVEEELLLQLQGLVLGVGATLLASGGCRQPVWCRISLGRVIICMF